jgi:hypothetical protein
MNEDKSTHKPGMQPGQKKQGESLETSRPDYAGSKPGQHGPQSGQGNPQDQQRQRTAQGPAPNQGHGRDPSTKR